MNLVFYLILLIAPIVVFLLVSNSNGATFAGVTGSPGDDGNTCTACHADADIVTIYDFSINQTGIPINGYEFSKTYHITLTPIAPGATKFGFQITAENASASKIGVFLSTDTNTWTDFLGQYVTHTFAGHENITSWSFDWTAPPTDRGAITFYIASIVGEGTSSSDTQMLLKTVDVSGVLGVNKAQMLQFSMYPNPSEDRVTLQLPSGTNKAKVQVFDYLGKTMIQKNLNNSNNNLDVSNLSAGIYFVRIQTDTKVGTKKLVVR